MRITRAVPPGRDRRGGGRLALTLDSDLGAIILRMIATHSLTAFTPAVSRPAPAQPVRGVSPAAPAGKADGTSPGRTLEAVPAQPSRPLPRGSLLDLRV